MNRRPTLSELRAHLRAAIGNPALAVTAFRKLRHQNRRRSAATPLAPDGGVPQEITARKIIRHISALVPVIALLHKKRWMKVGVADIDFQTTVATLVTALPSARIYLDHKRFRADPATLVKRALAAQVVTFAYLDTKGRPNRIEIEMYQQRHPKLWVSVNTANRAGRALYATAFATPGLYDIATFAGGQTLEAQQADVPVDIVFTWVNHADPDWQAAYARYSTADPAQAETQTDAAALTRFHNRDELRYALRAILQYLPWAQRIFVVSNCAPPAWLAAHKRLVWVPHEAIIPQDYLPTFNSHVIESCLHHIPDLSEDFVYFNDDMFVCRAMTKAGFFNPNGTSRAFMEDYGMVTGMPETGAPDYLNASRNAAALLRDDLGYTPTQLHKHAPYALQKSLLAEIETRFATAIAQTRAARFRSMHDINVTSFLYHHYAYAKRRATFEHSDTIMVRNTDLRWRSDLAAARTKGCTFLCINEGGSAPLAADWLTETQRFLERKFPHPAPWESDANALPKSAAEARG